MGFSIDSTLRTLLADERAREVLFRHFGDRRGDPQINMVMDYTLRGIAMYPEAGISQQKLAEVDQELRAL